MQKTPVFEKRKNVYQHAEYDDTNSTQKRNRQSQRSRFSDKHIGSLNRQTGRNKIYGRIANKNSL